MNILIFTQYFWPENFRINEVARTLVEKGVKVEVLTGKPNYPTGLIYSDYKAYGLQKEFHCNLMINRVPMLARGKGVLRLVLNYFSFIFSGLFFSPWLFRKRKYDVIFVYAPSPILQALPAIFLGWLKVTPVVIWVQDLWPQSLSATGYVKNKLLLKFVENIVSFIYRHADLLLVQSEAFIDPVRAMASGTPVRYYPNSADELSSDKSITEEDNSMFNGKFTILFAGNIGFAQAVEVIVEAASLLKEYEDIQFVILGDGSRRDWMLHEKKSRNLNNLHLPGRFPANSMPFFMKKASVLLVTLADEEIFRFTIPSKIQAYLAAGRPILACLNGESARIVLDAKAGLVVPAEDAEALTSAILNLYKMPSKERDNMGKKGASYCKRHFNHNVLIDDLINHFQSLKKINRK